MSKKMWQFKTRNFTVRWLIAPDVLNTEGLDKDTAAEWRKNVRTGVWKCFQSEMQVVCNATGITLGEADLGGNIYEDPATFRDHFGMTKNGHGSYFADMVKDAIAQARRRFPEHQAFIAKDVRQKQKVLAVKLNSPRKTAQPA